MNGLRSIDMNRGRQIHTCILESRQIDCRFSVCFYECFFLYNLIPIMSARWKYIYIFVLFPLILFKTILEKNKTKNKNGQIELNHVRLFRFNASALVDFVDKRKKTSPLFIAIESLSKFPVADRTRYDVELCVGYSTCFLFP